MNADRSINVNSNGGSVPARITTPMSLTVKPVADIVEQADAFIVALDLPGSTKDQIEIVVEPGHLAVRATIAQRPEETGRRIHREIAWNRFEREFKLGSGIDEKRVEASFTDGVLTVTLPKSEESKLRLIRVS